MKAGFASGSVVGRLGGVPRGTKCETGEINGLTCRVYLLERIEGARNGRRVGELNRQS